MDAIQRLGEELHSYSPISYLFDPFRSRELFSQPNAQASGHWSWIASFPTVLTPAKMVVWVDAFLNSILKPGLLPRPLPAATVGVSTSINYALSEELRTNSPPLGALQTLNWCGLRAHNFPKSLSSRIGITFRIWRLKKCDKKSSSPIGHNRARILGEKQIAT
jgi:hypothetical protein